MVVRRTNEAEYGWASKRPWGRGTVGRSETHKVATQCPRKAKDKKPTQEVMGGQIRQDPGGHTKDVGLYEWHGTSCKGKQRSDPTCLLLENRLQEATRTSRRQWEAVVIPWGHQSWRFGPRRTPEGQHLGCALGGLRAACFSTEHPPPWGLSLPSTASPLSPSVICYPIWRTHILWKTIAWYIKKYSILLLEPSLICSKESFSKFWLRPAIIITTGDQWASFTDFLTTLAAQNTVPTRKFALFYSIQ